MIHSTIPSASVDRFTTVIRQDMSTTPLNGNASTDLVTIRNTGGGIIESIAGTVESQYLKIILLVDGVVVSDTINSRYRWEYGNGNFLYGSTKLYATLQIVERIEFKNELIIRVENTLTSSANLQVINLTTIISMR